MMSLSHRRPRWRTAGRLVAAVGMTLGALSLTAPARALPPPSGETATTAAPADTLPIAPISPALVFARGNNVYGLAWGAVLGSVLAGE